MTALEPALGLLSALTSLPAVLYYARALGAAAVHPVREGGRADRRLACEHQLLPGTEAPGAILAGYVVGLCCVWTVHMYTMRRKHA